MTDTIIDKKRFVYDYELERQKTIWAYIILTLSLFTFFLTIIGFTDGLSEMIALYLENSLGFTNKWSGTFGPEWWVIANKNIAALGGKVVLFVFTLIFMGYFIVRKKPRRLWKFIFIIFGGAVIMITFKIIFADELPYEPLEYITTTISVFPSGHTMMGTIFYMTLAVFIARAQHTLKTKRFTIISGSILIVLIGFSRFLIGNHTVTEVLAGWSLGLSWLCFCWFLDKYIKRKRREIA